MATPLGSNIPNQVAYLRTSRNFPTDSKLLAVELTKSYIDIANAVNNRTISLFSIGKPTITGESWFLATSQKQQTLRQVYTFTSVGNIPHGIDLTKISGFSRCWGQYTAGGNWYGVIFANNMMIMGQLTFYIDPTNIVIQAWAAAPLPDKGTIILEWLSNV